MALIVAGKEVHVDRWEVDTTIEGAHPHPACIGAFALIVLGLPVVVMLVGGSLAILRGVGRVAWLSHGLGLAARATGAAISTEDRDIAPHQVVRLVGSKPRMALRDVNVPGIVAKGESASRIAAMKGLL